MVVLILFTWFIYVITNGPRLLRDGIEVGNLLVKLNPMIKLIEVREMG